MKTRHNKKRNTAFIFETLVREVVKTIISRDAHKKKALTSLIVEHFKEGTALRTELECFDALAERSSCDTYTAEKIIFRVKEKHAKINKGRIFEEQSRLIQQINKQIGRNVFANFVPSYRTYATIAQIFSDKTTAKHKVLMERQVLDTLIGTEAAQTEGMKTVDSLVVKSCAKRFNEQYTHLIPEQKNLLSRYVLAFGDNEVDFKMALSDELHRIHAAVKESLVTEEVKSDPNMRENTLKVMRQVESMDINHIGNQELKKILKLQELVSEYTSDAD